MQSNEDPLYAQVEEDGRIVLSPELASRYGVKPDVRIHLQEGPDGLYICRPARLTKLYIEPTNQCNLNCSTCMRNVWNEPMGKMSDTTFAHIIQGLSDFSPPPTIFFGGFGEPLYHPGIVSMVAQVKALSAPVELITNATLLTPDLSRELVRVGLDRLWVSIDGATPESYADIRLGAALPQVLENLACFREVLYAETHTRDTISSSKAVRWLPFPRGTRLGIVFVAMKRNINDLAEVINIGKRLGADRFMVTNLLPYSREMVDEALYFRGLSNNDHRDLSLPRMDAYENNFASIYRAIQNVYGPWAGINSERERNRCPFIANGAGAVSWDGGLSPCLPLLHNHTTYHTHCSYNERFSRQWVIGKLAEQSLLDLWNTPEHIEFRERVQAFSFPPCTKCGFCGMYLKNEEDCYGNAFPTCGGCMWAQGVIQCP